MPGAPERAVTPLFLAGHLALDFVNTVMSPQGDEIELIGDGRAFVDWLVAAGVLDAGAAARLMRQLRGAALDDLAAEARELRRWATAWIARWQLDPGASYEAELRRLNALLVHVGEVPQVVQRAGRFEIVEERRGESPGEVLATIARQIANLLVNEQPGLVKRCEGAHCTLWFVDRTKAHRRRFCSVAVCGNRDKVAAFRARQRQPPRRGGRR